MRCYNPVNLEFHHQKNADRWLKHLIYIKCSFTLCQLMKDWFETNFAFSNNIKNNKMIAVTGASGQLGKAAIEFLLKKNTRDKIIGVVRDIDKGQPLKDLGIEIRQGDYNHYESLLEAFEGVEKLLLISAPAFTDLAHQHMNVINAARDAGVKHIVYTSIFRSENAKHIIPWVTESNEITENYLKVSGLDYTILRNTFYADNLPYFFGEVISDSRLVIPGGDGAVGFATRSNLAEAAANVLAEKGHENKTYSLNGSRSYTFSEIAAILSKESGKEILYVDATPAQFIEKITGAGFPLPLAEFWAEWAEAFKQGDMQKDDLDSLEVLIGRKPTTLKSFLKEVYFPEKILVINQ